jgi:DNA polymerase-3 subunit alpha
MRNNSKIKFVNLHGHSTIGSLGDAIGYPQESMDFAYENGMDACALTDHGTMNGFSYQYLHARKMKDEGKTFKPIYGCEFYFIESLPDWRELHKEHSESKEKKKKEKKVDDDVSFIEDERESKSATTALNERSHMVLLAQNEKGLQNLFWLVSHSFARENFYRYPRIDLEMLRNYSEGIIATSACLGGLFGKILKKHEEKEDSFVLTEMQILAEKMRDIFGDRFFLELQWNSFSEQHRLNKLLILLSEKTGIQLVSTADYHYPNPELWKDREVYKKLAWLSKSIGKEQEEEFYSLPKSISELKYEIFPKNGDQMFEAFRRYSEICGISYDEKQILESIERTFLVAQGIQEIEPDRSVKLPNFIVPSGENPDEILRDLAYRGLTEKRLDKKQKYLDRLEKELKVIISQNFSRYFLTQKAICDEGQKVMILGPGRGCFLPDTRVKMSDGLYNLISTIKLGENVIDAYGQPKQVQNKLRYDIDEEILELVFANNKVIRCTKDHKFLTTNRGWVAAQHLTDSDDIQEI